MPHLWGRRPDLTLAWSSTDTIAIGICLVVASLLHGWRIGEPNALVYDEVTYVGEAFQYLRREAFFELHPPLAILLTAAAIRIFGCYAWGWRIASATLGTALVPITYLLARRMFNSRLAGAIASTLVLCDGMFLIYSRLALINIAYLTFGAAAYLMLLRFIQSDDRLSRRRTLVWIGIALGLGLASKFAVPGIAWLLTVGFLLLFVTGERLEADAGRTERDLRRSRARRAFGVVALVGGVSAICYFAVFLPHFWLGWWSGLEDLIANYRQMMSFNSAFLDRGQTQFDSPWWSWPLMLRPYKYWGEVLSHGQSREIWGGGNPAIWWGALIGISLAMIRALRHGDWSWCFLITGYLAYTAMWVPIQRVLYQYSYMPALFLAILALAGMLECCWGERTQWWEQIALLLPIAAAGLLGLGWLLGTFSIVLIGAGYLLARLRANAGGRFVCALFLATTVILFFYFLPIWTALPMSRSQLAARMWLSGGHIANWW